jgi:ribonuclease-3 family protein
MAVNNMENIFSGAAGEFMNMNKINPDLAQPLVLAYIGDSVYDLYIRTMLVNTMTASINVLHKTSINFVKAHAQSEIIHSITENLSEHEQYIVKRGRNAKSGTIPKNANVTEYKYATGLEALIGYLYLSGDTKRLMEILSSSVDAIRKTLEQNKDQINDLYERD